MEDFLFKKNNGYETEPDSDTEVNIQDTMNGDVTPHEEIADEAKNLADNNSQEFILEPEDVEHPEDQEIYEARDEVPKALAVSEAANESQLSFDEKVIEKLVHVAISEIDGVLLADGGGGFFNLKGNRGITIRVNEEDEVCLDLEIVLEYGKSAPEVYEILKKVLQERISQTTGLKLNNVNVHVNDVLTPEEFAEKR